jgi:hypothetical protein
MGGGGDRAKKGGIEGSGDGVVFECTVFVFHLVESD